jgi:very-short-patch-repair endonuclease
MESVRSLARDQLGLVTQDQLDRLDVDAARRWRCVQQGVLERVGNSVYRAAGAPITDRQRALAAVLDAGVDAAASHTTGGALWAQPGYQLAPHHASRLLRGNRASTSLAIIHEPKRLLPTHLAQVGPIPVTTPSRTLFDLAGMIHPGKLARSVDDALVKRLTNVRALHEMLDELAERGRPGIRAMREVLRDRPMGYRPPESHLEARTQHILRKAGLPEFERQVDVGDEAGWIGRVDFLYRPRHLILMVDGHRWHSALLDRLADDAQSARLVRAGFEVIRVSESQVWLSPDQVVARVKGALYGPPDRIDHVSSRSA